MFTNLVLFTKDYTRMHLQQNIKIHFNIIILSNYIPVPNCPSPSGSPSISLCLSHIRHKLCQSPCSLKTHINWLTKTTYETNLHPPPPTSHPFAFSLLGSDIIPSVLFFSKALNLCFLVQETKFLTDTKHALIC